MSLSLGAPKPASKLCFNTGRCLIGAELASLGLSVLMQNEGGDKLISRGASRSGICIFIGICLGEGLAF